MSKEAAKRQAKAHLRCRNGDPMMIDFDAVPIRGTPSKQLIAEMHASGQEISPFCKQKFDQLAGSATNYPLERNSPARGKATMP
jgi:hypothetical protein